MPPVLNYEIVQATSAERLKEQVNARLPSMQPAGNLIADIPGRTYLQAMVEEGGAVVMDGMEISGVTPSGVYTDTVTLTVLNGEITGIALS